MVPEEHADRLTKLHQSGVGETDYHRVRCRRALDDRRDQHADQHSEEFVARDLLQQGSQLVTGGKLQAFAHAFHADKEQSQTAQRHNDA